MKRPIAIIIIVITNLFLSSCGPGQLFGATFAPTPTNTPTPINIVTPRIINPYGLVIDWGNIPLMPGATLGELKDKTYSFKIKVKPDEVKNYYELKLTMVGWKIVKFQLDPTLPLTLTPQSMILLQGKHLFQFIGWDHQLLTFKIDYQNEMSDVEIVFGTYGSYY